MTHLEFQGVSKTYGERVVLQELSFKIQQGERVVVHGPSGCGKTTVLRLLAGFLAPDRGAVCIGGRTVATDQKIVVGPEHRKLGMVFQDLALWPHLTVAGNLDFVLRAQKLPVEERTKRTAEMLARVHLEEFRNAYPTRLSGGQQQRVAIARGLIAQPEALLMDEPLASLDDELKDELCTRLLELHSQLGFTLIYVTHSREEMRRIGERAILLRDGKELLE